MYVSFVWYIGHFVGLSIYPIITRGELWLFQVTIIFEPSFRQPFYILLGYFHHDRLLGILLMNFWQPFWMGIFNFRLQIFRDQKSPLSFCTFKYIIYIFVCQMESYSKCQVPGLGPKYSVLRYFGTRVPILQYSSVLSTRTFKKYLYSYLYF